MDRFKIAMVILGALLCASIWQLSMNSRYAMFGLNNDVDPSGPIFLYDTRTGQSWKWDVARWKKTNFAGPQTPA